mmetsp:Transcript_25630/g.38306  ORF Transcript_25630/g.38306 Transcript_25630/m.38306 type:complete len:604 (-) Transcript_25630:402-2213(-)|eukprot:CAMPEP_0116008842 /NCGR_PEP_ID=MMETSP0321-20121206/3094_1 /TAXON_ID=163516 /ORGANISM="Leptocylindrus danicus var. danicus, Strain B650" /LENGTH=603 /DNA_ID=CAMNT_0003477723 /DNA_START=32 /DNA_END=1843 /DNA_ORIENTATION=+
MKNRFVNLPFRWRKKSDNKSSSSSNKRGDGDGSSSQEDEHDEMHVDATNSGINNPPPLILGPPRRRRPLNVEVPDLRCVSGEVDAQSGRWFTPNAGEPPALMRKSSFASRTNTTMTGYNQEDHTGATTTTSITGPQQQQNVKLNVKPRSAFRPNALLDRSRSRSGDGKSVIITSTRPVISKFHSEYSHYYLGKGAFGDVFKATTTLRTTNTHATTAGSGAEGGTSNTLIPQQQQFAIKRVHIQKRSADQTLTEVRMMQYLQNTPSNTNHNGCIYLVQFMESWKEEDFLYIRMELCVKDSCRQMLQQLKLKNKDWNEACVRYPSLKRNVIEVPLNDNYGGDAMDCGDNEDDGISRMIPEQAVWQICHDVASALEHMHSLKIVHHDVKPSNILFALRENNVVVCKLGDFGLAGEVGSAVDDGQEGDFSYMPKELLAATSRNTKQTTTDVFSLGITLYEVAASSEWVLPDGGERWHDIRAEGHVLELPRSHRSVDLMGMIQRMVSPNVMHRPSASDVIREVQHLRRQSQQQNDNPFLLEFVQDVQRFDEQCEREIAAAYEEAVQRCITPTDAMLTSGLHSFNVTPVLSTPSKDTDSPASPPHFQPT